MTGSRTIKTLTALVMAMTIGTFVLMLLEWDADPLEAPATRLAAVLATEKDFAEIIRPGEAPYQPLKWRNVVVHSAPSADSPRALGCHFLVHPAAGARGACATATQRWDRQADGQHIRAAGYDFNRSSIGVCLIGEFSSRPPSRSQFEVLVALVRQLCRGGGIASDRVYVASVHLGKASPGPAFPAERFGQLVGAPSR